MARILELQNLTKFYGNRRGIENVSLTVEEGEIFGFIGPNGAGKSTTIRSVLDIIHPTSGKALVFGKDCQTQGEEIRQNIGYLPSEVFYYENMKVGELLEYSASFYKKDCKARIKQLCEYMELDTKRKIDDLSFGNKKKVGIVQGLLHSPKLIILDEPSGGLDPLMQQKFFDLLLEENKRGVTIFFSSHILSEVQRICHRVAIIKNGSIVEVQEVSRLRENTYAKVRLTQREGAAKPVIFDGVSNMTAKGGQTEFLYKGKPDALLRELNTLSGLETLWIEEPGLEEIFMSYYEDGERK